MDKGMQDTVVRSFFFSGQAPEARPARCPMLTCNGRSCKCTSPAMAGYRPVKVYMVLSLGCNNERQVATARVRLQRRARQCSDNGSGCQVQTTVHIVFHIPTGGRRSRRTRNFVPQEDCDESPLLNICGNINYLTMCIGSDWIRYKVLGIVYDFL
jgi:hypothetical protein